MPLITKTFILGGALIVAACAHPQAANPPYEHGVPPAPTHCGNATCADNEYCRTGQNTEQCLRIPIVAL